MEPKLIEDLEYENHLNLITVIHFDVEGRKYSDWANHLLKIVKETAERFNNKIIEISFGKDFNSEEELDEKVNEINEKYNDGKTNHIIFDEIGAEQWLEVIVRSNTAKENLMLENKAFNMEDLVGSKVGGILIDGDAYQGDSVMIPALLAQHENEEQRKQNELRNKTKEANKKFKEKHGNNIISMFNEQE